MRYGEHTSRRSKGRRWSGLAAVLAAALVMAIAASPAQAGKGWRFKETFGSANQPTFTTPTHANTVASLALDDAGRLYVFSNSAPMTVSRWNPDGTPANFAALSTNVIDGAGGADTTPNGSIGGFRTQVAVDNSGGINGGNIYVNGDNRVNIFAADGSFLGLLTACDARAFGGSAMGVSVGPDGDVYVSIGGSEERVDKFEPTGRPPVNGDCTKDFPMNSPEHLVVGSGPTAGYFFARSSGSPNIQKRDAETGVLEYVFSQRAEMSVDPVTGALFAGGINLGRAVVEYDVSGHIEATEISRLEDARSDVSAIAVTDSAETFYLARQTSPFTNPINIEVWEAGPTPTTVTGVPEEILGGRATVTGTVDPEGVTVSDCFFEYGQSTTYGQQKPCQQYLDGSVWRPITSPSDLGTGTDPVSVRSVITGLRANEVPHHYQLVAVGDFGRAPGGNETLTTAETYFTGPASNVTETAATLNGTVKLEGVTLTECKFQWGLTADLGEEVSCAQAPGSIPTDDNDHAVTATLSGLDSSTVHYYRLAVRNAAGQIVGEIRKFGTKGVPGIEGQMATALGQSTATLQAFVNPFGSQTDYHFEWGTDTTYANRIPAQTELDAGSGDQPVVVSAELSNLDSKTTYYFRVVANNSFGPTEGPDHAFQSLNEHGLPDNRAFELVTPADKGPAGSLVAGLMPPAQGGAIRGSRDGSCLLWPLQNAMPESTAGGWTRWLGCREAGEGWPSRQVSGPSNVGPSEINGLGFALPSRVLFSSEDLGCGVIESPNQLTADTPELSTELRVFNLYVWRRAANGDISYQLITDRVPLNPEFLTTLQYYSWADAAEDCSRVYFRSLYELIDGSSGLYVWGEGPDGRTLYDGALLPDGLPATSIVSPAGTDDASWNVVSPDGERFFFTATANEGPSSGKQAVFMRDASDGSVTEVSRSQTAVANNGARYQAASADGRRVIFLANYGIADETSDGPTGENCANWPSDSNPSIQQKACDLYAYDVETEELTSLSADSNPADAAVGAQVQGAVGLSDSGTRAYFAALGQLVLGEGRTYAENVAGRSANLYLASPEGLSYVTNLRRNTRELFFGAVMGDLSRWTAQTSADGRELLFAAGSKQNWYDGGGGKVVYLYSADTGEIACISCRPDGEPTLAEPEERLLGSLLTRRITEDGSRIFFTSPDVLMPGAEAGELNVYEWHEGQLYFLAVSETGSDSGILPQLKDLHDVSADGKVAFLSTGHRLAPQDRDALSDVYAVRVDGGIPMPPDPDICDPLSGGSCEGQGSADPESPGAFAAAAFQGAENPPVKWPKSCPRGKRKVTRGGKARCVRKQAKKKGKRAANKTRRAGR